MLGAGLKLMTWEKACQAFSNPSLADGGFSGRSGTCYCLLLILPHFPTSYSQTEKVPGLAGEPGAAEKGGGGGGEGVVGTHLLFLISSRTETCS